MNSKTAAAICIFAATIAANCRAADDDLAKGQGKARKAVEFHMANSQRTGVLVPLYVYPTGGGEHPAFKQLAEIKREFETVPIWVIANPASGPGKSVDKNYVAAIDRLVGSGCVVLGYVTTSYAKKPQSEVQHEIDLYRNFYPRVHGIFFDEMVYESDPSKIAHQVALNKYAHDSGFWPTVANPGTDTPAEYFAAEAADVIVVHEGNAWPREERIRRGPQNAYEKYPPSTRCLLIHSTAEYDRNAVQVARKHARWLYVTEDIFEPNNPQQLNPWDGLSKHMVDLCRQLAEGH